LEAESNRIGNVYLPQALWTKMRASDVIEVQVPIETRVWQLITEYSNLIADPCVLKENLRRLISSHGPRQIEAWCRMVDAGAWRDLVRSLLEIHYDPAYAVSSKRCFPHVQQNVTITTSIDIALDDLAQKLHQIDTVR
jgi:tRNA 2-selenouridine synthase